ncbi:hypothetical protein COO60DRAFT_588901 [Scenedesmus sp. NREL 46B-D3]|nr:hypothetical protein COO60DRAFT_588901 [Scenedesmus sp. NREL 46B-D3]
MWLDSPAPYRSSTEQWQTTPMLAVHSKAQKQRNTPLLAGGYLKCCSSFCISPHCGVSNQCEMLRAVCVFQNAAHVQLHVQLPTNRLRHLLSTNRLLNTACKTTSNAAVTPSNIRAHTRSVSKRRLQKKESCWLIICARLGCLKTTPPTCTNCSTNTDVTQRLGMRRSLKLGPDGTASMRQPNNKDISVAASSRTTAHSRHATNSCSAKSAKLRMPQWPEQPAA